MDGGSPKKQAPLSGKTITTKGKGASTAKLKVASEGTVDSPTACMTDTVVTWSTVGGAMKENQ